MESYSGHVLPMADQRSQITQAHLKLLLSSCLFTFLANEIHLVRSKVHMVRQYLCCLVAQMVKNLPAMWETWIQSLCPEDPLEKGMTTHSSILGLPWWLSGRESACNARAPEDTGSIPRLGRSPGGENGKLPAPGFLPGEFHGQRSLAGYSP